MTRAPELIAVARELADLVEPRAAEIADDDLEGLRAELQRAHDAVGGEIVRRAAADQ